jgi:hypothetical protein
MDVVYTRCCGIDIHKRTAVACVIVPGTDGQPIKTVRTFGTMTDDLLALADWLASTSRTWRLRRPASTGNHCGICSKPISPWSWPIPNTSKPSPAVRRTSRTLSGCAAKAEGEVFDVEDRTELKLAASEMEVGPPEPPCRGRLQTTVSCVGQEPVW